MSWTDAAAEATASDMERKNRALQDRVRHLEKQLHCAAAAAERQRKAKAVVVRAVRTRKRHRRDKVRVVFGDVHGSKMAPEAVSALLSDIKSLEPNEIIIGGDLVDCGGFLAQHHTLGYVAETEYSYEDDIKTGNDFLDALQDAAPAARIEALEGNHESRVEKFIITQTLRHQQDSKFLRDLISPEKLLQLRQRGITYYQRHEQHGNCRQPGFLEKGKCFFVHEVTGSSNAAADALRRVAGNIVFFHTHRADTRISSRPGVGNIGAWNPGCLCLLKPMWQHSKPNDWTHGYGVQLVAPSGNFLHINVPIVDGQSLLIPMTTR